MDKRDFATFYDKHFKTIYRFVYFRAGGSKETAEDYTHDIFLRAFEAFERYDPSISGSAWIFTIARNYIINQAAKNRPHTDLEEIENTVSDGRNWEAVMEVHHDQARLLNAIRQLPMDEADLVRMKYLEGWKYEEIAECTGKTSGSLRVQSCRVLKKLKLILKQK
ncbi:MAG TPA: sigma-70 family RNA polymerase sigma factor [Candidatus Methylomirabilis sp.]|nr:sigma-70 family RNA polymerase sigma factor [Candidatus Methylomirabilis sp.]